MLSSRAVFIAGLIAGLATVALLVLLVTSVRGAETTEPGPPREPAPTGPFEPYEYGHEALEPLGPLRRFVERLRKEIEALKAELPPAEEARPALAEQPRQPANAGPPQALPDSQESAHGTPNPDCTVERQAGDGITRTSVRCEQRVVVQGGSSSSVSVSSYSSVTVSSGAR